MVKTSRALAADLHHSHQTSHWCVGAFTHYIGQTRRTPLLTLHAAGPPLTLNQTAGARKLHIHSQQQLLVHSGVGTGEGQHPLHDTTCSAHKHRQQTPDTMMLCRDAKAQSCWHLHTQHMMQDCHNHFFPRGQKSPSQPSRREKRGTQQPALTDPGPVNHR